jgi:cyclophilin family peptidyl-prolyl cis-trans isomerase
MANEAVLGTMLTDPELEVRRRVLPAVLTLPDTAAARRVGLRALFDPTPRVRTLAVAALAQRFGALKQCAPFLSAAHDSDVGVRIAGVDALAAGCELGSPAVALLDSLASRLPAPNGSDAGAWHLPAHALVTLATLAPAQARSRGWITTFAASPQLFVREYAARAATQARDTTTLRRLVDDPAPNVRTSAIAGLSEVVGHGADGAYVAALGADDNQVLLTAATALAKSRDARAVPALLMALDRVTATRVETQRDARVAILERLRELGDSTQSARLTPYLADFDTLVALRAADAIGAWTGRRPTPAAVPLPPVATPTYAELQSLAASRLRLEMADGRTIVIRLLPFDAPNIAARVARLARDGRLDGLTFHRVVPARLIQGLSPNANEYAGWGRFSRDELWRANRRGTVGVSTRGRDTGDAQMYVNIADNFDFDHNYTVYGEVLSGMEIVDAMQEGAVVRRATIVRP